MRALHSIFFLFSLVGVPLFHVLLELLEESSERRPYISSSIRMRLTSLQEVALQQLQWRRARSGQQRSGSDQSGRDDGARMRRGRAVSEIGSCSSFHLESSLACHESLQLLVNGSRISQHGRWNRRHLGHVDSVLLHLCFDSALVDFEIVAHLTSSRGGGTQRHLQVRVGRILVQVRKLA